MDDASPSTWALRVKLATPIVLRAKDDGEVIATIAELQFREPNALDIIEVGVPMAMDMYAPDPLSTIRFDGRNMSLMMARLSAKPLSTIGRMTPADWTNCAWKLSPFFLPAQESD